MTNFLTIKEAKEAGKGSFVGTVIGIGDLKSGTSAKGDWAMKIITLQDETDKVELAAFNEEIDNFKVNDKYKIENPWWKEHEGKLSLNLGQYAKVEFITHSKQTHIEPPLKEPILEIPHELESFTIPENIILKQISSIIARDEKEGQIIGLRTKEIYRQWKIKHP